MARMIIENINLITAISPPGYLHVFDGQFRYKIDGTGNIVK